MSLHSYSLTLFPLYFLSCRQISTVFFIGCKGCTDKRRNRCIISLQIDPVDDPWWTSCSRKFEITASLYYFFAQMCKFGYFSKNVFAKLFVIRK